MRREYQFWVYIMASESGTLYVGMTNNILRRVYEHKTGKNEGFTKKYKCERLVWVEEHRYVYNAIEREKELKGWKRERKEKLISSMNCTWRDLADGWYWDKNSFPMVAG